MDAAAFGLDEGTESPREDAIETLLPATSPVLGPVLTNRRDIRVSEFQLSVGLKGCTKASEQRLEAALTSERLVQRGALISVQSDHGHGKYLLREELKTVAPDELVGQSRTRDDGFSSRGPDAVKRPKTAYEGERDVEIQRATPC